MPAKTCAHGSLPSDIQTTILLKDMVSMQDTHRSVHEAFMEEKCVRQRSSKKYAVMALDHSQEHSIKFLKKDSGAKGLYGQPEQTEVIELSKPEVLRVINEFETANLFHQTVLA